MKHIPVESVKAVGYSMVRKTGIEPMSFKSASVTSDYDKEDSFLSFMTSTFSYMSKKELNKSEFKEFWEQ